MEKLEYQGLSIDNRNRLFIIAGHSRRYLIKYEPWWAEYKEYKLVPNNGSVFTSRDYSVHTRLTPREFMQWLE
jgi:hypothetical protein